MSRSTQIALCNDAAGKPGHLALCAVNLVDAKPPEWIKLVPSGDSIAALDGRKFSNSDPQAVVDAFRNDPRDVAIDYDHASELKAPKGEPAPAAGWVTAMEVRDGAVWGKVDWTPRGLASVESREYRYISPAFALTKASKLIFEIVSAALTNRPAFDMPALARDEPPTPEVPAMHPKLLALLGLTAESTPAEIDAAIEKLEAVPAQFTEAKDKLAVAEQELANARAASPSLDKYVPRADYDVEVARAKAAESTVAETAKASHDKDVEVAIASALKAGKITPATKGFYIDTCADAAGLEKFNKFAEGAAPIGKASGLDDKDPPAGGTDKSTVTESERAIARSCGLTDEEFIKGRA